MQSSALIYILMVYNDGKYLSCDVMRRLEMCVHMKVTPIAAPEDDISQIFGNGKRKTHE